MTMDNDQHGSAHFFFRAKGKPGTVLILNEGPDAPNDADLLNLLNALKSRVEENLTDEEFSVGQLVVRVHCNMVDPLFVLVAARDALATRLGQHAQKPVTPS